MRRRTTKVTGGGQKPSIYKNARPAGPPRLTAPLGPSWGLLSMGLGRVATRSHPRFPAEDNGRGGGCGGAIKATSMSITLIPAAPAQFTRKTPNVKIIATENQIATVAIVRAECRPLLRSLRI